MQNNDGKPTEEGVEMTEGRSPIPMNKRLLSMYEFEFAAMLEQAAQKGATEALARIGLHDENAGSDIYALRDLIKVIRQLRSAILNKVVNMIIITIIALVLLGFGKWVLGLGVISK